MSDAPRLTAALQGRYAIGRELGSGGMATVYLAHDEKHDRKVAVKVLRPELAAVMGADRFLSEIRTTANLQHPHILPLFDSGEADGFLFYVMPYVEGETLQGRMDREKQLPVADVVYLGSAIAGALDYAHRQGVIHRDIEPANILLHDGQPLVADFGIALAVQQAGGGRLTETGLSLGTPFYMSPEQATADRDPDARSDVYSLACVVYEMLTGEPPFAGSTAQAVLGKIITSQPTPPSEHRKSIPAHLEAVVLKALEKLPADRFESAADFAEALKNPAVGQTLLTQAVGGTALGVRVGSPRLLAGLATGAAVAATLAAWGWLRPLPEQPVSRYEVVLPVDQALPETRDYTLAMMRDGSGLLYAGEGEAGVTHLFYRPWNQFRATLIDGTEGAHNPSPSPDGSRIAFVTGSGSGRALRVAATSGGGTFTVTDSLVDEGSVSWGHDGYIYYDGHLEGDGVARAPETGGSPEVVTMPDVEAGEAWHFEPFALPDGAGVLFTIARGNVLKGESFQVGAVAEPGGVQHVVVGVGHAPVYTASGHLLFLRNDQIMAAPFDVRTLQVTGHEVPVVSGIETRALGRADYAVSSQGTLAYLAGSSFTGRVALISADRTGTADELDIEVPGIVYGMETSPDGGRLALSLEDETGRHIWVADLPDGSPQKLTFDGSLNQAPSWSANGDTILFAGYMSLEDTWGVFEVPADGSGLPRVVFDQSLPGLAGGTFTDPVYSPDMRWIVWRAGGVIYAYPRSGGGDVVEFAPDPGARNINPQVSPEGRWLAYGSDESGRPEVYVRAFPDLAGSKRLVSRGGGQRPVWSDDGSELFYIGPNDDVLAVDVQPGEAFQFGAPSLLFSRTAITYAPRDADYDVDPAGERFFLYSAEGGASASRLVIVENFFRELREKVGG